MVWLFWYFHGNYIAPRSALLLKKRHGHLSFYDAGPLKPKAWNSNHATNDALFAPGKNNSCEGLWHSLICHSNYCVYVCVRMVLTSISFPWLSITSPWASRVPTDTQMKSPSVYWPPQEKKSRSEGAINSPPIQKKHIILSSAATVCSSNWCCSPPQHFYSIYQPATWWYFSFRERSPSDSPSHIDSTVCLQCGKKVKGR